MGRPLALPNSLPPRGLSREAAAELVGISATKFDQLVVQGAMPRPKRIGARKVWDRLAVEAAFTALPEDGCDGAANPWDDAR